MRLGVCYYPEHWPEARWAIDAAMMRDLGLEIVRIAEFAWAKLEPAPGRFEFGWLDRAIDVLASAGLEVVLGTPTVCPPAWMIRADPTILPVDAEGRRRRLGGRRHYCPNSAAYREHARRIVTALAERYGRDPRVIGWQIDNELGGGGTGRCYCPSCEVAFRDWLRARYGTLEHLNEAWATVFWSQTYTAWEEIAAPILQLNQANPSHALDYRRFSSDSIVAFERLQVEILRSAAAGHWVTTNLMGLFADLDHHDLAADLDFATWDSYPTGNLERWEGACYGDEPSPPGGRPYAYDVGDPYVTGLAHELTRGLRNRPFWVMEQQPGPINWGRFNPAPRDGTVRLWTWHALAAGADTCVYFRWRACLFAQEQYHAGLLHHDASPAPGYREVGRLAGEREAMARVVATPAVPRVALLFDYDDLWAIELQPHRRDFSYLRLAFAWYRGLARLGIAVDIVPVRAARRHATGQRPLADYAIVVAPTLHLADAAEAAELADWVRAGGTLLLGVRSGMKTTSNRVTSAPLPGDFRDLVGATVTDWHGLPPGVEYPLAWPVDGAAAATGGPGLDASATVWAEALAPIDGAGAAVAARYADGPLAGAVAITDRQVGAGRAVYVGVHPTVSLAMGLLRDAAVWAGVAGLAMDAPDGLPDGLVAYRRGAEIVALNFTDATVGTTLAGSSVIVAPRDVAIVPG